MKYTPAVVFLVVIVFLENHKVYSMTEAQIAAAGKLVRNMCQPKTKVTDEQLEQMHKGIFDDSKKLMCYIDCCYQTFKVMKNGQLDLDAAIAQIQQMPEERKQMFSESLTNCKDKAVGEQKCEASYNLAKCIYFDNPPNYLMP